MACATFWLPYLSPKGLTDGAAISPMPLVCNVRLNWEDLLPGQVLGASRVDVVVTAVVDLYASYHLNVASGPVMVLVVTAIFAVTYAVAAARR